MSKKKWSFAGTAEEMGCVGMVLCWYIDDAEDCQLAGNIIEKIPHLISGEWNMFSEKEIWYIYDALGSYPKRFEFEFLNNIYLNIPSISSLRLKKAKQG